VESPCRLSKTSKRKVRRNISLPGELNEHSGKFRISLFQGQDGRPHIE
jgi:hypothetical protein